VRLEDYLDTLNVDFELRRYPNQNNRWTASFDYCEIKEGAVLRSAYGNGSTPETAIKDYIREIRGHKIVFHAMDEKMRREYVVPTTLADSLD
jgi:hypothetical protein